MRARLPTCPLPHPQEMDDFNRGVWMTEKGHCKVCPGSEDDQCAKCANKTAKCLKCYDNKKYKPNGGFACVKK